MNDFERDIKKAQLDRIDAIHKSFDTEERKELSKEGEAEKDGSYPIRNEKDLENAIQSYGRSKDKEKTKNWIKKRAKELGKESMLPENW